MGPRDAMLLPGSAFQPSAGPHTAGVPAPMLPLRFAVLKAGTAYRETRERRGDFDRMFLDLLAEPGETWDVYDVEHNEFPDHSTNYDGFVITGGRYGAYDDLPWVRQLTRLVRKSHEQRQTLLGICFGHQVLAQALGGEVRPNPDGWDIGVRSVSWTPAAASIRDIGNAHLPAQRPEPLRIFELHQDVVTKLPPGAVPLASSDHTAYEAFSLGRRTLGVQGHPEFDADGIREALDKLTAAGIVSGERAARHRATLVHEPSHNFLRRWLRGFLKSDRRTLPVPSSAGCA